MGDQHYMCGILTPSEPRNVQPDSNLTSNMTLKYTPANLRPDFLTFIASKLMEHIVTSNIMKHANDNNILYDLQHVFRGLL